MAKHFDETKWQEAIQHPDWYLKLSNDYKKLMKKAEKSPKEISEEIKEESYQFFETNLAEDKIKLGDTGPNWDEERKPIDTIVIHHTKNPSGITWQRLSAMHLIRLYASYYASPHYEGEQHIKGTPIYSNHFRNGQMVFYAYHWLVRMDGTTERLLGDNEIGWHAGKWDINCKSVAICFDNDFENSAPPKHVLQVVSNLIKEHYSNVRPENIFGHREINPKTTCPGNLFLNEWKTKIVEEVL